MDDRPPNGKASGHADSNLAEVLSCVQLAETRIADRLDALQSSVLEHLQHQHVQIVGDVVCQKVWEILQQNDTASHPIACVVEPMDEEEMETNGRDHSEKRGSVDSVGSVDSNDGYTNRFSRVSTSSQAIAAATSSMQVEPGGDRKSMQSVNSLLPVSENLHELVEQVKANQLSQRQRSISLMIPKGIDNDEVSTAGSFHTKTSRRRCTSRIVGSIQFDIVCASMIFANAALIGWTTEHGVDHRNDNMFMMMGGHFFSLFFATELLLRLDAYRLKFFTRQEDRGWNVFDLCLVVLSTFDIGYGLVMGESRSTFSLMKTVKLLRIVRLFRVFRFFKELGLMARMVIDSLRSLFWALVMLIVIIYVFAIVFTQLATTYLREDWGGFDHQLSIRFGSLGRTIYSLILSAMGGISWVEVSDPLMLLWPPGIPVAFFFLYIAFVILAVLNIITGVFVENAVETAKSQRDFIVKKQDKLKQNIATELCNLFTQMDQDGSGTINYGEMEFLLTDPEVRTYFGALGMDTSDMKRLFELIDLENVGEVAVQEFLDGCLKLKGEAKSIDLHQCLLETRKLANKFEVFRKTLARVERTTKAGAALPGGAANHNFADFPRHVADCVIREISEKLDLQLLRLSPCTSSPPRPQLRPVTPRLATPKI